VSTSQLPWPSAALEPAAWLGVQRLLARCLELHASGALPATLLLVGASGLGREALALELAAALICRREGGAGCACGSCERVRRGVHPDLEIVAVQPDKSDISIEQAHRIVESLAQHPYEGMRRVYIVDSCQTPPLNSNAASALLKTLEEPPPQTIFLLLASNPARVLPTIVSRTVQLRVPPPSREELAAVVAAAQACTPERAEELLTAADGDAELILRAGADDLPAALAALEQLLAAALAGDGLAILRTAALLRQAPGGVALATSVLLKLAGRASDERAEGFLDADAALLIAENRRVILHLDTESVVVGVLARAAMGIHRPS
jgi:DNA polymerase III delta prime subunit